VEIGQHMCICVTSVYFLIFAGTNALEESGTEWLVAVVVPDGRLQHIRTWTALPVSEIKHIRESQNERYYIAGSRRW
jgi:hypothetical protein